MGEQVLVPVLPYKNAIIRNCIDLDFGYPHNSLEQISACQGDTDAVREVVCTLYRDGEAWTPPDGATVRIHYETPVGGKSFYEHTEQGRRAWKIEGNVLTFAIGRRVSNHIGINTVYLELDFDGLTIKSPHIQVKVYADLHAREPEFFYDEYVGHVYYNVNGVSSEKDPFDVWYPLYEASLKDLEEQRKAAEESGITIEEVYFETEELPEQEVIGTGALADPIHYDGNQYLVKNLYYVQDSVVYKCVTSTRVAARYRLSDLVGIWVEQVKVIPASGPTGSYDDPIQYTDTVTLERGKFYIDKGAMYLALSTASYHPNYLRNCSQAMAVADLVELLKARLGG